MTEEADLRLLDLRIEAHTDRIDALRAKRAVMDSFGTWALDQEIARHERWRSIQERLRDFMMSKGQRKQ